MGIREQMNERPRVVAAATGGLIVLVLAIGLVRGCSGSQQQFAEVSRAYFTVDDGVSWFADDIKQPSPFQKDGKAAYRVHVFSCDGGSPFAGYLERDASPNAKQLNPPGKLAAPASTVPVRNIELKLPKAGDAGWIAQNSPPAYQLRQVRCPGGKADEIATEVNP